MKLRSNEPFWLIKNGIKHSYPSVKADIETDIIIIGAGITGSLMAYQCIQDGYNTVIIDHREVGHGSTSATTALLQYEIDVPLYELSKMIGKKAAEQNYLACYEAIDILEDLSKKIKSRCGFKKKESLFYAAYKKDVDWLKSEFKARQNLNLPVTWISSDSINKRFGMKNTFGGILSQQAGSMDAFRFTHDLLHYSCQKGLDIYDKTAIDHVKYNKSGVMVHTETGHRLQAKKLIYCTGFESTNIIREKFVDLVSTYAFVGEQDKKGTKKLKDTVFWNSADPYIYMRATDDGRFLIGGGDVDFINSKKRDGLINSKVQHLHRHINRIFPSFNIITDFAWAGTFGKTKDGLPYIGEHPDFKSTYFVLGFGGNGITFSVIGMKIISDLLKGTMHDLSQYYRFGR